MAAYLHGLKVSPSVCLLLQREENTYSSDNTLNDQNECRQ